MLHLMLQPVETSSLVLAMQRSLMTLAVSVEDRDR